MSDRKRRLLKYKNGIQHVFCFVFLPACPDETDCSNIAEPQAALNDIHQAAFNEDLDPTTGLQYVFAVANKLIHN